MAGFFTLDKDFASRYYLRSKRRQGQGCVAANTPPHPFIHKSSEDGKDQEMERESQEIEGQEGQGRQHGKRDEEQEHDKVEKVVGKNLVAWQVPHDIVESVKGDDAAGDDPDRKQQANNQGYDKQTVATGSPLEEEGREGTMVWRERRRRGP